MKPQEQLPHYLHDLFARSSQCLEEPQVEKLKELAHVKEMERVMNDQQQQRLTE